MVAYPKLIFHFEVWHNSVYFLSKIVTLLSYETLKIFNYSSILSFRIHSQMFDFSDPHSVLGSLGPLQGLPGTAQLDMNVSCLFMHEVN